MIPFLSTGISNVASSQTRHYEPRSYSSPHSHSGNRSYWRAPGAYSESLGVAPESTMYAGREWYLLNSDCPVTSLEQTQRVAGSSEFTARLPYAQWGNARFRFASEDALEKFEANPEEYIPALCGFCPVAFHERQVLHGDPAYQESFDGHTYWMSSEEALEKFREALQTRNYQYLPVFGGDCLTCWVANGDRIPGHPYSSHYVDHRLYLFPNDAAKWRFINAIDAYLGQELAFMGRCPVARKQERRVNGQANLQAIHNGFVYLFENEASREEFDQNPDQYAMDE